MNPATLPSQQPKISFVSSTPAYLASLYKHYATYYSLLSSHIYEKIGGDDPITILMPTNTPKVWNNRLETMNHAKIVKCYCGGLAPLRQNRNSQHAGFREWFYGCCNFGTSPTVCSFYKVLSEVMLESVPGEVTTKGPRNSMPGFSDKDNIIIEYGSAAKDKNSESEASNVYKNENNCGSKISPTTTSTANIQSSPSSSNRNVQGSFEEILIDELVKLCEETSDLTKRITQMETEKEAAKKENSSLKEIIIAMQDKINQFESKDFVIQLENNLSQRVRDIEVKLLELAKNFDHLKEKCKD
ncbi:hypothetical protein G9A89_001440 [Geosiphon pyriformis]|nr:hypothetical protein G9A89_001440 [Geosiphon pyriformis]